MVYAYFQNKCAEYQNNPNLQNHMKINLILIALTIILRVVFEIFLRSQLALSENDNQVGSFEYSSDNNKIQNEDHTHNNQPQISYMILDQLLHLFLSLEIIFLVLQITLIINKRKQELSLTLPILNNNQEMTCSVQFVKSSNYGVSSLQNNQATLNSIEMQFLSRNKKGVKKQITNSDQDLSYKKKIENYQKIESQEAFDSNLQIMQNHLIPNLSTNNQDCKINTEQLITQIFPNDSLKQIEQSKSIQSEDIEEQKQQGRAEKKRREYIQIIQKCEKNPQCNFFWISQNKSREYICLNCDQGNKIIGNQDQINQKDYQQNRQIEPVKFFLSNKFEHQLFEICSSQKTKFQFCENFDLCGFFWMQNSDNQFDGYYCPICMNFYAIKLNSRQTLFQEIDFKCSYCNQTTSEYFQTCCLHQYHFDCVKELWSNTQNQTNIHCITCNINITKCLRQNKLLPNEILEKIFFNQIQKIRQQNMKEGIEAQE
ncbi:unnamed protein product [Paramecium sonneborni]|uniref:RING-type domain-containing protein n=1 Tax=Paramecium sonneborni TaxID=65129 RepID=A0A8S1K6Q8_9CILI|nr:unnamed protein product [Paramecium sonneborni]